MCGGGGSSKPKAQPAPQFSYYPESARNPQQQAANVEATGAQSQANFGNELTASSMPSSPVQLPAATTGFK